jgi:hypothetical protein
VVVDKAWGKARLAAVSMTLKCHDMMNLGDLQLDLLRTLKLRKLVDSFRRDRAADIEVFVCSGANSVALSMSGPRFSIYRLTKSDGDWLQDEHHRMPSFTRNSTHGRRLRFKLLLKVETYNKRRHCFHARLLSSRRATKCRRLSNANGHSTDLWS